jgi:phosphotransferase system enzyme I (PtsI)/phosphotransferase system enzyme I (PtsP)
MDSSLSKLVDIVQKVSRLSHMTDQLSYIVNSVCESIDVDVCSLYGKSEEGDLTLLASQGLTVNHPITIPKGRGLVGLVVANQCPVNIDDASSHPDYYYVALSKEESFHSFCGVPLVRKGVVIGVLVAQRGKAEKLAPECEAFLVTLAAHLALIIPEVSEIKSDKKLRNIKQRGISGAPGIAIGKLWQSDCSSILDVREARCNDVELEIEHWHQILNQTKTSLKNEQLAFGGDIATDVSGIFDAYMMLLSDQGLLEKVESDIKSGHSLSWALRQAVEHYSSLFFSMDDPYLKARGEDILNLGNKLYQMLLNEGSGEDQFANDDSPIILMGAKVSISDIAKVPKEQLMGIVCFDGSALSHTAVLANALGVPAIMGTGVINSFENGATVIVDGDSGQIVLNATTVILNEYKKLISDGKKVSHQLQQLRDLPAVTLDNVEIDLFTNTGLLADITPGVENGAGGVGLYRTEIPFMIRTSFPSEDEQIEVYSEVCRAYKNKAV